MPQRGLTWYSAVDVIKPHVVRISTPTGMGTGFLLTQGQRSGLCAIATAAHVIAHAHYWEEPIRIDHTESKSSVLIRKPDRAIILHEDDTAAVVFHNDQLSLPSSPLPLHEKDRHMRVGSEIAWLGFPAIPAAGLCFFGGRVSSFLKSQSAYLVDGVAINGVSGGPAFFIWREKDIKIMGVVSAYAPNRATGEVLPGLSVVRKVEMLHEVVENLSSFDQAKEQETPPTSATAPAEEKSPSSQTGKRAT